MADEQPKKSLTEQANPTFTINLDAPSNDTAPAVVANAPVAGASAGGLSYQSATPEEKKKIEAIMATIDLTKSDTVIALGAKERETLATLADQVLDSVQPGVKIAFVEALKELIDAMKANSLDQIKQRISSGAMKNAFHKLGNALLHRDPTKVSVEDAKEMIGKFMNDISNSRKIIREMTDKLVIQKDELDKNFERINVLGASINDAAQEMRIVRAASAEYIRRADPSYTGSDRITVLTDLQAKYDAEKRSDDAEKLREAQAAWNALRTQDGDLLGSISVYDMNVANLAFTKEANLQNRMQTKNTLTNTVAEWKTQLAVFATVATENAAGKMLQVAGQLTEAAVKSNKELFDQLVDTTIQNAAHGTYNLRQLIEAQGEMATKLEGVGAKIEAQFDQLAKDKGALEESSAKFRERVTNVYSKGGAMAPKPKAPGA